MGVLRKAKDFWRGLIYRLQKSRRLEMGVHRASAASQRRCSHCVRFGQKAGHPLFSRCQVHRVIVHRGDVCKRFVLDDECWQATQPFPEPGVPPAL